MDIKARLKGHKLTRLSALLAVCECGSEFRMLEVEASGRKTPSLQDELMDRHSNHLALIRYARGEKLKNNSQEEE